MPLIATIGIEVTAFACPPIIALFQGRLGGVYPLMVSQPGRITLAKVKNNF